MNLKISADKPGSKRSYEQDEILHLELPTPTQATEEAIVNLAVAALKQYFVFRRSTDLLGATAAPPEDDNSTI